MSVSGMITLPVNSSVYQTMVANIQQLQSNQDGTLCITPMQVQNITSNSDANVHATQSQTQHQQHHNHRHHHHPQHHNQHQNHNNSTTTTTTSSMSSSASAGSGSSTTAMLANTTTTMCTTLSPIVVPNLSYPLYDNPYVAHQQHLLAHPFGHPTSAHLSTVAARSSPQHQLKLKRNAAMRGLAPATIATTTVESDALLRSLEKHLCNTLNNSQSHSNNNNNNNNNSDSMLNLNHVVAGESAVRRPNGPAMLPKVEHVDDEHSQAIIDSDGNIIIRFGNGAPIKIECDSSDLKI